MLKPTDAFAAALCVLDRAELEVQNGLHLRTRSDRRALVIADTQWWLADHFADLSLQVFKASILV